MQIRRFRKTNYEVGAVKAEVSQWFSYRVYGPLSYQVPSGHAIGSHLTRTTKDDIEPYAKVRLLQTSRKYDEKGILLAVV